MITLDEVIKAIEECRDSYVAGKIIKSDALYYLKIYRDTKYWLDLEKRNYAEAVKNCERSEAKYTQMILDMNRNVPLTWDELKQMEGKPVWVEGQYPHSWCIVREVQKYMDGTEEIVLDGLNCMIGIGRKEEYGTGWQAYRKER